MSVSLRFVLSIIFLFFTQSLFASDLIATQKLDESLENSIAWLSGQQNPDGSYGSSADLALQWQSGHEASIALSDVTGVAPFNEWYKALDLNSLEYIGRSVQMRRLGDDDYDDLLSDMSERSSPEGGMGDDEGFDGNVKDTLIFLEAVRGEVDGRRALVSNALSYLISQQREDGSIGLEGNPSSLVLTARCLKVLRYYQLYFELEAFKSRLAEYIVKEINNHETVLGTEIWQLSEAVSSIVPYVSDMTTYSHSVNFLLSKQEGNGSWDGSIYTTAVTTKALKEYKEKIGDDPIPAIVLQGKVIDNETGLAVVNARIALQDQSATTDISGFFEIKLNEEVSEPTLEFAASGYQTENKILPLVGGGLFDVGLIPMSRLSNVGILEGVVRGGADRQPLAGAEVLLTGVEEYVGMTDNNGYYRLSITPGDYEIQTSHDGYIPAYGNFEISSGVLVSYSPLLNSEGDLSVAVVEGTVIDGVTASHVSDASITAVNDDGVVVEVVRSNSLGQFELFLASSDSFRITVEKGGYQTLDFNVFLKPGINKISSIAISPESDVSETRVLGSIYAKDSDLPIYNAKITLRSSVSDDEYIELSNSQGMFEISSIVGDNYKLSVEAEGYRLLSANVVISDGASLDVGKLNLYSDSETDFPSLSGVVLSEEEMTPLAGAQVSVVDSSMSSFTTYTDSSGSFQILNDLTGTVDIEIAMEGFDSQRGSIAFSAGDKIDIGTVVLKESITGVVIEGKVIDYYTLTGIEETTVSLSDMDGVEVERIVTDQSGNFETTILTGINRFSVQVEKEGYVSFSGIFDVETNKVTQLENIRMVPESQRYVSGRVSDIKSSEPISGVSISLRKLNLVDGESSVLLNGLTNEEGIYYFDVASAGEYEVLVSMDGYISDVRKISLEDTQETTSTLHHMLLPLITGELVVTSHALDKTEYTSYADVQILTGLSNKGSTVATAFIKSFIEDIESNIVLEVPHFGDHEPGGDTKTIVLGGGEADSRGYFNTRELNPGRYSINTYVYDAEDFGVLSESVLYFDITPDLEVTRLNIASPSVIWIDRAEELEVTVFSESRGNVERQEEVSISIYSDGGELIASDRRFITILPGINNIKEAFSLAITDAFIPGVYEINYGISGLKSGKKNIYTVNDGVINVSANVSPEVVLPIEDSTVEVNISLQGEKE